MTHHPHVIRSYASAAGLGIVAGMRTQLPLAVLALAARRDQFGVGSGRPLSLLRSPGAPRVFALSAVGELVGDKLPVTPSRLDPGPLFGRLLFGGLAGAVIAAEARRSAVLGGALGAAGAFLGAKAGFHARTFLDRTTDVPDPVWGAVEDACALALGLAVLRSRATTAQL